MSGTYTLVENRLFLSEKEAEETIATKYNNRKDVRVIYNKDKTFFYIATPKTDEI